MRILNFKKPLLCLSLLFCVSIFITSCSSESISEDPVVEQETIEFDQETIDLAAKKKNPLAGFNTNLGWHDSFSYKGRCYCKTTFDHGIGKVKFKGKTVKSICNKMKKAMQAALKKSKGKVTYYNTVQCGHAPAHKDITIKGHRDEVLCPGIVGKKIKCNSKKGPKWKNI